MCSILWTLFYHPAFIYYQRAGAFVRIDAVFFNYPKIPYGQKGLIFTIERTLLKLRKLKKNKLQISYSKKLTWWLLGSEVGKLEKRRHSRLFSDISKSSSPFSSFASKNFSRSNYQPNEVNWRHSFLQIFRQIICKFGQ